MSALLETSITKFYETKIAADAERKIIDIDRMMIIVTIVVVLELVLSVICNPFSFQGIDQKCIH